jgi:hypothetical protein
MCLQYNNCCKITKCIVKTREVTYTVVRFMDSESHARTCTVHVKTGMAQRSIRKNWSFNTLAE